MHIEIHVPAVDDDDDDDDDGDDDGSWEFECPDCGEELELNEDDEDECVNPECPSFEGAAMDSSDWHDRQHERPQMGIVL